MNKNTVFKVKDYLEDRGIVKISDEITPMDLRKNGKFFQLEEHIQGMIYSLMSAQTVWANIERNKPNIDKIFFQYNPEKILEKDYTYFVDELGVIRCRSRLTNGQMKVLHDNVRTFMRIEDEYGSVDAFLTSKSAEELVEVFSKAGSRYKLKMMGEALVREYLRNVGVDSGKPDVHMKRIMGNERLGVSCYSEATNEEVVGKLHELSEETGFWMSQIDYIFWAYCATGMGEICTANPRCDKCVIRDECRKGCKLNG